ncbi:MAG: PfkB family carbohydrate kinase [Desulfobacterales bacterium]|jgi:sulfofructose kinase
MKMKNIDVLVIGRSCLDYIAVVNQFPQENQKIPLEYGLSEAGGQGSTASCCISRLGGKVAYVGKLGDDDEGRFCLKRLKDFGVATDFIEIIKEGKTPVAYAFITAAGGHRTIIYERNELPKITIDSTLKDLLVYAKVVLLDPEATYLGKPLHALKKDHVKIVYDGERWREGIEDIMATVDYFVPSSELLDAKELHLADLPLCQQVMRLNKRVFGNLIVTHGRDGVYYVYDDRLYHIGVPEVNAIDTIGAGDNFHGALALALAQDFDLHQAVKFSVAVASLSCREYGGRKGIPQMPEALAVAQQLNQKVVASV